jgi:hypothetical protein
MERCPQCGLKNPQGAPSCSGCGLVFSKEDQSREARLSDLSAKVLGWDEEGSGASHFKDLTIEEGRYRKGAHGTARFLAGFLYLLAILLVAATGAASIWTWNLLVQVNGHFTWPVLPGELAVPENLFTTVDMLLLTASVVLIGLVLAGLVAAVAAGLNLGRASALEAHFAREYLARLTAGREEARRD